jgi:hypothetical protein
MYDDSVDSMELQLIPFADKSNTLSAAGPLELGSPSFLLRPEVLGAMQPTRLSASRVMMRQAIRERWDIRTLRFDIEISGRGFALYRITTPGGIFDLPVFSYSHSDQGRTGRIIGRTWDMMAGLVEGPMSDADIEQTRKELPKLYAGRATPRTLVWCRSNRSSRAFEPVVEALARGRQPAIEPLARACYLMRNTGLDGNGTFGTRTFRALEPTHPLRRPLAAQMLCGYMMRVFAEDLANHIAHLHSPMAARLSPEIGRFLGVGNNSALGLTLFVNNHPRFLSQLVEANQTALRAAKALSLTAHAPEYDRLVLLLDRVILFREQDRMVYDQFTSSEMVARELKSIRANVIELRDTGALGGRTSPSPLAQLYASVESEITLDALSTLDSLLIELVPELADSLVDGFSVDEEMPGDPMMPVGRLRDILHADYAWALTTDTASAAAQRYVWYKSATAEEPRRGPRDEVPEAFNLALDLPRLAQNLEAELKDCDPRQSVARFLVTRPDLRFFVARVQSLTGYPYHSPRANFMAEDYMPAHMTHLMNAVVHGVDKTRDYLNGWLRGVLFHGAPTPDDLRQGASEDWYFPAEPKL